MNPKFRIGIVASRFNEVYVNGMLDTSLTALKGHSVEVVRVPGAYEIPLAVQRMIRKHKVQIVIAFGVIWKGKTMHDELIARTVTDALMRVSLEQDVPVLHQVLTVSSEAQAKERCLGKKLNRGREAAEAALAMLLADHS